MDKTSIMVDFSIIGDDFSPSIITERLNIVPTEQYNKGELSKKNLTRKESCWSKSTGYIDTLYVSEVLEKIMMEISDSKQTLIELREEFDLVYKFIVVLKIEQNQKPAVYLETSIIQFASEIEAEIDFDFYIY
ncbi:DUF4279 domain-containing protein [Paenibacillus sp. GCM10027627]|uniref:DUF4279 domain-containing protein n=1 Tax=unclassified Paenibacillus TaxID=185978 RepID=UPI003635B2C2